MPSAVERTSDADAIGTHPTDVGQRIVVVGTTCAGKTTLAQNLAQRLRLPHIELDALHWGPNWTPAPRETFRQAVAEALHGATWVTDGNYSKVQDIVWSRADTVIWLDYPFPVIFGRLIKRTFRRVVTRETLWNGNRESWRGVLLSRDSLLLWAVKTHNKRRRRFLRNFDDPAYAHLAVTRLRLPGKTRRWLDNLVTSVHHKPPGHK